MVAVPFCGRFAAVVPNPGGNGTATIPYMGAWDMGDGTVLTCRNSHRDVLPMTRDEQYRELIECLNTRNAEERRRKKHRLPMECYTASDCEFFFTVCARHHKKPFIHAELAAAVVESLLWRKRKHNWTLLCYCLMPDHLHFIVRLRRHEIRTINAGIHGMVPEGVLDHVAYFKSYTTTQLWWKRGGKGLLWQRSSYDRVVRYYESAEAAVYYALNNPVRAGLVEKWEDYPYAAVVDAW